jgi:hypothetical protein
MPTHTNEEEIETTNRRLKMYDPVIDEDETIKTIIESKIGLSNTDGSWVIALMLMRSVQVQKEISTSLKSLVLAIAENDVAGTSLSEQLSKIAGWLGAIEEKVRS